MSQMQIIAHRGNSVSCHENTMAAFERAVANGADGIEFDVRLTKDRQWVVHHDADVAHGERLVLIQQLTLADVMTLRVGPNRDPIPRMEDFLLWARGQSVALVFDIKDHEGIPELVAAVERAGLSNPTLFSSFHRGDLKELESLRPGWHRGLILGDPRSRLARRFLIGSILRWSRRHRITSLHFAEHWILPSLIAEIQNAGIRVAVWTVDDPVRITLLAALGVDGIITNCPDRAREVLRPLADPTTR